MVRGVGEDTRVPVQPRVPIIDPPAVGADGSRYYITVLAARGESPPDDLDEIRDRLVEDMRRKRAFDILTGQVGAFREAAVSGGLDAVAALGAGSGVTPTVATDVLIGKELMAPTGISRPDPAANRPAFRAAVVEAGAVLDPLAEADTLGGPETVVVTPLPSSQSVAVAKIRAKRPPTLEDFQRMQAQRIVQGVRDRIAEAQDGVDPLGYTAMVGRLGYEVIGGGRDEDEDAAG